MGRIIPYFMENKKCSKPPTSYIYIYVTGFFIIFMNQLFNDGWFICPNMDSVNELNVCKALGRPTSLKLAWICLRSPKPTSCYRENITAIRHSNQLSSCIFHRRNKHNAPTHTKHDKTLSDYMITLNPISVFNWLSEGLTIPGPMKKKHPCDCAITKHTQGFKLGLWTESIHKVKQPYLWPNHFQYMDETQEKLMIDHHWSTKSWGPFLMSETQAFHRIGLRENVNRKPCLVQPIVPSHPQIPGPILGVPVAGNVSRVTGLAFCTRSWRAKSHFFSC
jgi:hypothetical protein